MADDDLGSWEPFAVREVEALLEDADVLWWLSGGVALEVFLQRSTRAHGDIDVSLRRSDWPVLRQYLGGKLHVKVARNGLLWDLTDQPLEDGVHNLWARYPAGGPWRLQINLEPVVGEDWVYRRDGSIRRPVDEVVWWRGALPYVNPAVQLLWKTPNPTAKDELDFAAVAPHLPEAEWDWLSAAIELSCPTSPWRSRAKPLQHPVE